MEIEIDFREMAEDIQVSSRCFLGEDAWSNVEVAVRNELFKIMPTASAEIIAREVVR